MIEFRIANEEDGVIQFYEGYEITQSKNCVYGAPLYKCRLRYVSCILYQQKFT